MIHTVDSFFIDGNMISSVISEEDYRNAFSELTTLEALARMTYPSLYVIDYNKKKFMYVSDNPLFLCGNTSDEVKKAGYSFYLQHVPLEEIDMLLEINRAGFEFYARTPIVDRKQLMISYEFHLLNKRRKILVNHKMTPLRLARDGSVWLAVCVVSFSSYKDTGHIEMRQAGLSDYWRYSLEHHKWEHVNGLKFSDREKDMLLLSARGYKIHEIAERLCYSVDAVKFHRQQIFNLLKANNITEALEIASKYKLF